MNNICVSSCLNKLGVKFDPSEVHGDLDCGRKEDLLGDMDIRGHRT